MRAGHAGAVYTPGQRKLPAVRAQVQGGGRSDVSGRRGGVPAGARGVEASGLMCHRAGWSHGSGAAGAAEAACWAHFGCLVSYLNTCIMVRGAT